MFKFVLYIEEPTKGFHGFLENIVLLSKIAVALVCIHKCYI